MSFVDRTFELGQLYCDRGDFELAIDLFLEVSEAYLKEKRHNDYLKVMNLLIRVYAEREQYEEVHAIKDKLHDLVIKEGFTLNAKTYYTFGICAAYKKQIEVAMEHFQKSLSIALVTQSKEDMCYAISGIATCYTNLKRFDEAIKEISNLEVFFQVIDLPTLKISVRMVHAAIYVEQKKYDRALELYWSAYEELKSHKNMFLTMSILTYIGGVLYFMGQHDAAKAYLLTASRAIDSDNAVRLAKITKKYLDLVSIESKDGFDMIFHFEDHFVEEKQLGKIDFKNQFILLDLLKLFIQNQGQVYSKEYLVENIWKQPYDPGIHDNKIYVTIKRLRKMIEPDIDKPKYIFRAKNGYFMNKSAQILMDGKAHPTEELK